MWINIQDRLDHVNQTVLFFWHIPPTVGWCRDRDHVSGPTDSSPSFPSTWSPISSMNGGLLQITTTREVVHLRQLFTYVIHSFVVGEMKEVLFVIPTETFIP